MAIASEEELGAHEPAEDLVDMEGMERHLRLFLPVVVWSPWKTLRSRALTT